MWYHDWLRPPRIILGTYAAYEHGASCGHVTYDSHLSVSLLLVGKRQGIHSVVRIRNVARPRPDGH